MLNAVRVYVRGNQMRVWGLDEPLEDISKASGTQPNKLVRRRFSVPCREIARADRVVVLHVTPLVHGPEPGVNERQSDVEMMVRWYGLRPRPGLCVSGRCSHSCSAV